MTKSMYFLSFGLVLTAAVAVEAQNSQPGRKYALLVGVNRYQHPRLTELRFCENDVSELGELLQSGNYQVTVLRGSEATRENIERRLSGLLRAARRDDSVVVAFAGHGLQFEKDAYFCPVDGRPFADQTAELVSLTKVYEDIDRSFAGVKVLLVDACRNDGTRGLRGVDGDNSPRPPRGVAAFFSCAAGEVAHEHEQFRHGIFFHYVLQGLRGEARNSKGQVTFASLVDYVSSEVTTAVHDLISQGASQSPNMKADLQGASPVLFAGLGPVAAKRDLDGEARIADLQAKLEEQQKMLASLYAQRQNAIDEGKSKEEISKEQYEKERYAKEPYAKEQYEKEEYTKDEYEKNGWAQLAPEENPANLDEKSYPGVYRALRNAGVDTRDINDIFADHDNRYYLVTVIAPESSNVPTLTYRVGFDGRVTLQPRPRYSSDRGEELPPLAPPSN